MSGTPPSSAARRTSRDRRHYLDWLRGVAVLIMIEAHVTDAWTVPADRASTVYRWTVILGGFGAPLFLFLAGTAVSLAAGARYRRHGDERAAARSVQRRGWQIFGYAFLFRLQSFVLNAGAPLVSLLKVDILNVMGPAIALAGSLWQTSARRTVIWLASATALIAWTTPIVRASALVGWLPDPIEWYFRPVAGRTNFTLLPWAGFVTAGALVGRVIDTVRPADDRRIVLPLGAAGVVIAAAGFFASFLPSLYAHAEFWTSSPTYFFVRLGVMMTAVALAWAWDRRPWPRRYASPLVTLGIGSLFVYWIHVELVYGFPSAPLHRRLPLSAALAGVLGVAALMWGAVIAKNRVVAWWEGRALRARAVV